MEKIQVKIKRLDSQAKIPEHKTQSAAGFDIYASQEIILNPGETTKVSTGIAFEIPEGFYVRIEDRSGMAIKGIHKVAGIVDSDYRGEVSIVLHNSTKEQYKIEKHDRIAQGILSPVMQGNFTEAEELSETARGEGGFNSTGR
jgi:dUTP pyrophosphatase